MILTLLFIFHTTFDHVPVTRLRQLYFEAAEKKEATAQFKQTIEKVKVKDHIYYCYYASWYAIEANHASSIQLKLNFFKEYRKHLDKSIALKDSFDARFIRFCVQVNSPKILGYKENIKEDKSYILQHVHTLPDIQFKSKVVDFLLTSNTLNSAEKKQLKTN